MVKKTGKDGTFTLTLPPGPYILTFWNVDASRCVEKRVQVESGRETAVKVEFTLE